MSYLHYLCFFACDVQHNCVLFCLSSSCTPYVANSLDCFCFVCLHLVYPMLPILWIVFVLFIFVLYTLCCQFSGLFLFCLSLSCIPYVANSLDCFFLLVFVLYTLCCQFTVKVQLTG